MIQTALNTSRAVFMLLAIALIGPTATLDAQASDVDNIVIVVNARNPTTKVNRSTVKNIYLGNTAFWHGVVPIRVVMRPVESDASTAFLDSVLGISGARYKQTWSSRQLSGQGMAPREVGTPESVANSVRSNPGAIGFLLASEAWDVPPKGVRIIQIEE